MSRRLEVTLTLMTLATVANSIAIILLAVKS